MRRHRLGVFAGRLPAAHVRGDRVVAPRLIRPYEWRPAQLVRAIVAWVVLVPTWLLVRRAPAVRAGDGAVRPLPGAADPGMTAGQALRSPQFIVLAATYFCCCATHSGPIFHTVSYAIACGIAPLAAVTIYSVEGLAGLGGRVLFGLAGDRFGAKRVLVIGLFAQALGAGAYFFVRPLREFYAVAAFFGLIYGGVMPLYAVIAREYFPMRIMGTVFGAAAVFSSLGMALGPAVGGWIFDSTGSYGSLYIGSVRIRPRPAWARTALPPLPA